MISSLFYSLTEAQRGPESSSECVVELDSNSAWIIKSVFFLKLYQLWGVGENRYAWVPLCYPLSFQARSLESLYVSFPAVSHVKDLGSVASHFTAICGPLAEKGQWGCRNGELAVLTCFRLSGPAVGSRQVAPVSLHPGILQGLPSWRGTWEQARTKEWSHSLGWVQCGFWRSACVSSMLKERSMTPVTAGAFLESAFSALLSFWMMETMNQLL